MLYMVEMDLQDRSLLPQWLEWYREHVQMLLSIPGFLSAQRFQTTHAAMSPFLAIYTLADAQVLESAPYRAKAGPGSTGDWRDRMCDWNRNLLSGLSQAPQVASGQWLAVWDRLDTGSAPLTSDYSALAPVGLDKSCVERGVRVGMQAQIAPEAADTADSRRRIFRPISEYLRPVA